MSRDELWAAGINAGSLVIAGKMACEQYDLGADNLTVDNSCQNVADVFR
jgi:hypothetical protein